MIPLLDASGFHSFIQMSIYYGLLYGSTSTVNIPTPPDIWSVFSEPCLPLLRDERLWDAKRKTPWQGETE